MKGLRSLGNCWRSYGDLRMAHLRNDGAFAQGRPLRKPKRCHIHHRLFQVGRKGPRDVGRVGRGPKPRCSLTETVPIWGRGGTPGCVGVCVGSPRGVSGHRGATRRSRGGHTGGDPGPGPPRRLRGAGRPHRAWVRSGAGREAAAPLCPAHTAPPRLTPTLTPTHTPAHTPIAQPAGSRQHGRAGGGAARCRRLRAARVRGEWGGPPPAPAPNPDLSPPRYGPRRLREDEVSVCGDTRVLPCRCHAVCVCVGG